MTPAEISLAFAREEAGYPDAVLVGGMPFSAKLGICLPDYANDWNATIAVLKNQGMTWHSGPVGAWVTKGFVSKSCNHLKDDGQYTPRALCLAAIKCVRNKAMDKTKIQWTDATWNPLRGCSRVSAGCMNCYAEKVAARFAGTDPRTGLQMPYAGLIDRHGRWNGHVSLVKDHLLDPLRWKKPRKIFVNSMSDLFHENVPSEWIDRIFAVMALAQHHTFQVLTKRPERMLMYMREFCRAERNVMRAIEGEQWNGRDIDRRDVARALGCVTNYVNGINPLKNVWLGVSVENQETADERIPLLLETPAAVRFVSYEPALGPVDFETSPLWLRGCQCRECSEFGADPFQSDEGIAHARKNRRKRLDWIIVGGESGPGARRFDPAWARSVVQQCKAASVPVFVKQMGGNVIEAEMHWPGARHWTDKLSRKGDDPEQWPEELRVRGFPS